VDGIRYWMPLHTGMLKIWTLSVPVVKRDLLLLSKKDNLRKWKKENPQPQNPRGYNIMAIIIKYINRHRSQNINYLTLTI
jgi:hypothetical protein